MTLVPVVLVKNTKNAVEKKTEFCDSENKKNRKTQMRKINERVKIKGFFLFSFFFFFYLFLSSTSFSFADPKQIFIEQRCIKCHSVKSEDIKPLEKSLLENKKIKDHSDVGLRRDKDWIKKWLKKEINNEKGKKHKVKWKGSEEELDELAEWLTQLRTKMSE